MNAPEHIILPDPRLFRYDRKHSIQTVGAKGPHCPIAMRTATRDPQHTVAEFAMSVGFPHNVTGAQTSPYVEARSRTAEEEASCEAYGLLKRPDDKWATGRAYDDPKFVDDPFRDFALRLRLDPRVGQFTVASKNFESVHNHCAYAEIEGHGTARID
jgi:GTP cyclohydrolase FolE2